MSSGCGDVISLEDMQTIKKHQIFEAEVITGLQGGVAGGASIDFATNPVTGQVQKTMPAILRDLGFRPASFDFSTGGTLSINDRDLAVLWPAPSGDGEWYYWEGALPKIIPASSSPSATGGIVDGAWRPVGDITLRANLASSSTGLGDALIAVKYPTASAVATTQHNVNMRHVSILDFGGFPDGANKTEDAIIKIKADLGSNVCVEFPKIQGSGTYYFSNTYDPLVTSGLTFDCAPGVTFILPDLAYIHYTVTFVRDTPAVFYALGNCNYTYPATSKKSSQSRPIWHIEPDVSSSWPINPSQTPADLSYLQFNQGDDTQTTITPAFVSTAGVVFTNSNNALGQYGLASLNAGEEITVSFTATAGSTAAYGGMITTSNSRYWFTCGVTSTGSLFVYSKILGSSLSGGALAYEGQTTHDSYRLALSNVTLRKDSETHFSLLVNGFSVWETETSGPIVKMGFGATGGTGSVTVNDWVHRRHTVASKGKLISVSVFGDSITAPGNYAAWPEVMQSILDSNNGIRIANVYNYAVNGAASSAQLTFVNSTNLAKSNVSLIMLGVNDIQGGVSVAILKSNITTMVNTCLANGNIPIVAIPTMFYSQGQTTPTKGQATTNYSAGAPYRQAVLRTCAEMNVKVVDLNSQLGPILGNWNNTTLGIPYGDGIVFDNIHPTSNGRYLIARAFAAAILGLYVTDRDDTTAGMLPVGNLLNGWVMNTNPVGFSVDQQGRVFFFGSFHQPGSTAITDGTSIYSLPPQLRPLSSAIIAVANEYTLCRITVGTDGAIRVYGMTGGLTLAMDGVVLHTRRRIGDQ